MLGPFKAWRDVPGNEDVVEELTKIINAVEKVLAQPEQEPVCDKDPQGCWNVRCQLGKKCKNIPPQRTEQEPDDIASIIACRNMLDAQPVPPKVNT
jgi:hypothetical protein